MKVVLRVLFVSIAGVELEPIRTFASQMRVTR